MHCSSSSLNLFRAISSICLCILSSYRWKNEENKRQIIAFLTEKGEQFYTEHQRYDESMHRQMDEIALNRFNEEELQCIFEYEQIMEMLLKEEALTRHLTEKSKN